MTPKRVKDQSAKNWLDDVDRFEPPTEGPDFPWIQFGHKQRMMIGEEEYQGAFVVPTHNFDPGVVAGFPPEVVVAGQTHPLQIRKISFDSGEKERVVILRALNFIIVDKRATQIIDKRTKQRVREFVSGETYTKDQYLGIWLDVWPQYQGWVLLTVTSTSARDLNTVRRRHRSFVQATVNAVVSEAKGKRVCLPSYAIPMPLICGKYVKLEDKDGGYVPIEAHYPEDPSLDDVGGMVVPSDVRDYIQSEEQKAIVEGWKTAFEDNGEYAPYDESPTPRQPRPSSRPRVSPSRSDQGRGSNGKLNIVVSLPAEDIPSALKDYNKLKFSEILAMDGGRAFVQWVAEEYKPLEPGHIKQQEAAQVVWASL